MNHMALSFLSFEYSDDTDGLFVCDAVASVQIENPRPLMDEVMAVLEWGNRTFPSARGPLDEGADWDCAIQATRALLALLPPEEQAQATECAPETGPQGQEWHTLTLTLSGTPAFAEAFRERFGL